MNTLEIEYGPFAAHLALLLFGLLAYRFPTALAFSFMTTKAFSWASVLGLVNYAKALFLMQFLAVMYLAILALKANAVERIVWFARKRESFLAWVLVVVWLKIGIECVLGGFSQDRIIPLKTAPVQIFFPALIIFLGFLVQPPSRALLGLLLGMVAFPLVCIIPAMPGVLEGKRIFLALQGTERLVIWGLDTIQGGQFFFYAALGALGISLMAPAGYAWLKPAGWAVFAAGFFFLALNATRQFLLACVVGLVVSLALNFRRNIWIALCAGVFFVGAASFILGKVADSALSMRVSSDSLSGEVETSRGVIWRNAFNAGLSSPLRGEGFRNFGEVVTVQSELTGELHTMRDTAHGFFQEVWAEHGMLLGLSAILGAIWSLYSLLVGAIARGDIVMYSLFFLNASLIVTCLFSGAVYSSLAPYVLAASMFVAAGPVAFGGTGTRPARFGVLRNQPNFVPRAT